MQLWECRLPLVALSTRTGPTVELAPLWQARRRTDCWTGSGRRCASRAGPGTARVSSSVWRSHPKLRLSRNCPTNASSFLAIPASSPAARSVSAVPVVVCSAADAMPDTLRAMSSAPFAASLTLRPISFAVAVCSSTALAIADVASLMRVIVAPMREIESMATDVSPWIFWIFRPMPSVAWAVSLASSLTVGHHAEALARLARPRRLDRGLQGPAGSSVPRSS